MSEEHIPGMELMVPGIGEIVALDDPKQVAVALDGVRDLERQLRLVKTELTNALVYASQVEGTKTLHLEGVKATIKSGSETVYDAEQIEIGLREAGMPEERIREIVVETVTYAVAGVKAKQAAGANPAYAAVIEAHKRTEEKAPYVTISRS
jgi:hypothetical protein